MSCRKGAERGILYADGNCIPLEPSILSVCGLVGTRPWGKTHETNRSKKKIKTRGKNTALAAQESPATRAQVNSYSELWAKADCRAANGKCSASQWLQHLKHCARTECLLAGDLYVPELLFLKVGGKKTHCTKQTVYYYSEKCCNLASIQQMFIFSIKLN